MAGETPAPRNTAPAAEDDSEERALPAVLGGPLSGADTLFDGATHVGVAIEVSASGKLSYVMIPDATRITQGQPIYITRAITIKGEHLADFFAAKNVTLPDRLKNLIKTTSISCEAFYLAPKKRGPNDEEKKASPPPTEIDESTILMMFELNFEQGLIGTLADDPSLGKLFDITGAKLRVLRCTASSRPVLEAYARLLSEA